MSRRAQRAMRGEFVIGWIELNSAHHGAVDYRAIGVTSEYAVEIMWGGSGWGESPIEPEG